ncbi:MAG: hypothetical protein ACRENI_00085 [Gemmatimonadaceae bacterium]
MQAGDGTARVSESAAWLRLIGRMLAAFGLGVLATRYFYGVMSPLGAPLAISGGLCIIAASWGRFARRG